MRKIIIDKDSLRVNDGRKLDVEDKRSNKIKASFSDDELNLLDEFISESQLKVTRAEVVRLLLLNNLKSDFFKFSNQYGAYIAEVKAVASDIYDIVKSIKDGTINNENLIKNHLNELKRISSKYDLKNKLTEVLKDENYDFVGAFERSNNKNELTVRLNRKELESFEMVFGKYSNISRAEFVASLSMYNALNCVGFLSTSAHKEYINVIPRMINNISNIKKKTTVELSKEHEAIIDYYCSFSLHDHAKKIINKIKSKSEIVLEATEEIEKREVLKPEKNKTNTGLTVYEKELWPKHLDEIEDIVNRFKTDEYNALKDQIKSLEINASNDEINKKIMNMFEFLSVDYDEFERNKSKLDESSLRRYLIKIYKVYILKIKMLYIYDRLIKVYK